MAIALQRPLLHAIHLVGVGIVTYEPERASTVASLQDLCEDVEHSPGVAANGVVSMLLFVALNHICAPILVDGEVYPGMAALSLATEVHHNFSFKGDTSIGKEAR